MRGSYLWTSIALGCALSSRVAAQPAELPRSLVSAALSEPAPSALAPGALGIEDYALRRLDGAAPPPSVVTLELLAGSLVWVRVADVMIVPRAVLVVTAPGAATGQVRHAGFVQPLAVKDGVARAEVPVALLATPASTIEIELQRGGVRTVERYQPVLVPREGNRGLVMFDSSCSPHGVRVLRGAIADDAWLYVGCRQLRTTHADRVAATLELYTLWSGAQERVDLDDIETAPALEGLYTLRVSTAPGYVTLRARERTLVLGYVAPAHLPAAFVGVGVGPYHYRYQDGRSDVRAWLPLVTFYAGYALSSDVRFVYFNASIPDAYGSVDQGLYLWLEQARFLDDRLSFILLLGGNLLVYPHQERVTARVSIPQGVEFVMRDIFARGRNLTAGAFVYPEFEGRAYYNVWLRWGSAQLFGELNYIEWQEPHGTGRTRSRAAGVSFGTPLLRFL